MIGSLVCGFLALICTSVQAQMELEWVAEEKVSQSPKLSNPRGINIVEFPPVPPQFWSADGECVDNPTYAEDCKVWAEKGYCADQTLSKHYPRWMKRHCMASCRFCQTSSTTYWKLAFKLLVAATFYAWIFGIFPAILPRPRLMSLWMSNRKRMRTIIIVLAAFALYLV